MKLQSSCSSVKGSHLSPMTTRSGRGYKYRAWSKLQYSGQTWSGKGHKWAWPIRVWINCKQWEQDNKLSSLSLAGFHPYVLHDAAYMLGNTSCSWIVYRVSAHFSHDVFTENDYLLRTVFNPTGVWHEDRGGNFLAEIFRYNLWERWSKYFQQVALIYYTFAITAQNCYFRQHIPRKNIYESRIPGTRYNDKFGFSD